MGIVPAPMIAGRRGLAGVVVRRDLVVIRLPQPRLVRLVTRSLVLVLAVVSLPWLSAALLRLPAEPASGEAAPPFLPTVLADIRARGILRPGARAVFLGDPGSDLQLLIHSGVNVVSDDHAAALPAANVDLAVAAGDREFRLADRALKPGGVAAVRLGSDASELLRLPSGYRILYARRFGGALAVAMRKGEAPAAETTTTTRRRLLAVPEAKKEALNGLEEALLEPPALKGRRRNRTKYLPDLMGDTLDGYPRRVFVDVGPAGRGESEAARWFARHYPTRHRDFEMIRVDVEPSAEAESDGGMAEWLARNVREEEYVVVKAEAEAVEEMVKGRALGLVDELFLECSNQWEKGKKGVKSRRAYWECLSLYGKLRDEGVAVHQWWG